MCGIAGLIWKDKSSNIGGEMTQMLQALKHRGPDSTGYALYGKPSDGTYVMRLNTAEQEDLSASQHKGGFEIYDLITERKSQVDARMAEHGAQIVSESQPTEYAHRITFNMDKEPVQLAAYLEDIDGVEILSIGHALELVKDLGDAETVADAYGLGEFQGTHAIGHTRMATESDVDIRSAHPYWAYPFNDISVVHNGQLTNYWTGRRALERRGHRFVSNCDSEMIAVYIADRIHQGDELEEAMLRSIDELDGVFTYLVATANQLGMAKDVMAAKPMVLYESDEFVGLASEEVAIRSIFPREIDTHDPYEGEVKVWQA